MGRPSAWRMSAALTRVASSTLRGAAIATRRSAASRSRRRSVARSRPATAVASSIRRPASSVAGTTKSWPRFASPSEIRHSGVLIASRLASSQPRSSTSVRSFWACSRWWPGYVSWATVPTSDGIRSGRSVFRSTRDRPPPSYQL